MKLAQGFKSNGANKNPTLYDVDSIALSNEQSRRLLVTYNISVKNVVLIIAFTSAR